MHISSLCVSDVRLEFVGIFKQYLVLFTFTQSPVHHHCADSICDINILETVDEIFYTPVSELSYNSKF